MIAEIQGLRALAVLLVLVFHVWPESIPGGYVGVDVFFVISGYLITGALLRELRREGRIRLGAFYARRARRLLPAASLVLLATLLGSLWLLPASRWQGIALEVAASAAYVQNWVLAASAVDYWAAESAASPLQHFWSLSIEEQFYLVWPLALLAAAAAGARGIGLTNSLVGVMAAVLVPSFAASVWLTAQAPEQAYFFSHTRAWELALGGLLVLLPATTVLRGMTANQCATAGLALILAAAFLLDTDSAFPGYLALVPVIGAALVLHAGEVSQSPARALRSGPLRWVGDRSYSIYLWHWPLVVWCGQAFDGIDLMGGIGVIAMTLLLAHLTYEYVEQPFRHRELRVRPILMQGAALVGVCLLGAGVVHALVVRQADAVDVRFMARNYPGPAVLSGEVAVPSGVPPMPSLSQLSADRPIHVREGCHQNQRAPEPIFCEYGTPEGAKTVALIGDSHAGHWADALARIAGQQGWRLLTFTKSACPFASFDVQVQGRPYPSCAEWRERVIEELPSHGVEMVFIGQSRYGGYDDEVVVPGILDVWSRLEQKGMQIVAIADTPWFSFRPDDCLATKSAAECVAPRAGVVPARDRLKLAAVAMPNVRFVDMTDYICDEAVCPIVVGNLIAWRDPHHLTATYSAALAPFMARELGIDFRDEPLEQDPGEAKPVIELALTLSCEGLSGRAGFERRIFAREAQEGWLIVRGDYVEQERNYDLWQVSIKDGAAAVTGEYKEGAGGLKRVSMQGVWGEDGVRLNGKRGPRECEIAGAGPVPVPR